MSMEDDLGKLLLDADRIVDFGDWLAGQLDENEVAMAERGWVKLPVSIGDRVGDDAHEVLGTVRAVTMRVFMNLETGDALPATWSALVESNGGISRWFDVSTLELVNQPTVEDVLYDSLKHFGAVEERTPEVDSWVCEQAVKLRKMLEGDAE